MTETLFFSYAFRRHHSQAVALLADGCGSRSRARSVAHEIGVPNLRSDLQTLVASPAGQQHEIAKATLPASVQRFQPIAVQRHMGGVLIVTRKVRRERRRICSSCSIRTTTQELVVVAQATTFWARACSGALRRFACHTFHSTRGPIEKRHNLGRVAAERSR